MLSLSRRPTAHAIVVGAHPLTIAEVVAVARNRHPVTLAEDAIERMDRARLAVDALAATDRAVYGVSTGFGALAATKIDIGARERLQHALVRSHAAGAGPEVETEVVRALMLLRLQTLTTGRTGVRPLVAERYADLLNAGLTPMVHEYGSLGCSGDLAPLAHCALAVIGEGQVRTPTGELVSAAAALARFGLSPLTLTAKEGLSLINGTDGMLGMLALAIHDLHALVIDADIAAAMSVEALLGTDRVFAPELQAVRPHPGQLASATNLWTLLQGSAIVASHRGPRTARSSRTPTRCAAHRRWLERYGTRSTTPRRWRASNWPARSTTPSSSTTAASRATATSTVPRSATCSTSWPSPPPTSPRSANAAPTGCWTRSDRTAYRRSWPPIPASIPA